MNADELFLLSKLYTDRAYKLREIYTTCNSCGKSEKAYGLYIKCINRNIEIYKLLEAKGRYFK